MAAVIAKNELVASKRRVDLEIYQDGALTLAPRSTDFIALGYLFVLDPANLPHYKLGGGTCTNKRRILTFTSFTFTANSGTDQLNKVAHGLETGDGPINVSNSGGGLPAPLAAVTGYWVIKVDADNFYLATSLANAYASTRIDITTNGTGTQTLAAISTTQRGLDGRFVYEFTQAETNIDVSELSVIVESSPTVGYMWANNGGAYSTANSAGSFTGLDATAEGSNTALDLIRGIWAVITGKSGDYTTGTYTFKDPATGTKTRVTVTANATGRTVVTVGDLT